MNKYGIEELIYTKNSETHSISAENFTGEKGKGGMATDGMGSYPSRELGIGWKVSPCITIKKNEKVVIADIRGEGIINHFWATTCAENWRSLLIKIYWDDAKIPSVQTPFGDFFCNGWCEQSRVNSLLETVNPQGGFNSYWQMPFKRNARFEIENISDIDIVLYYQIDYEFTKLDNQMAYFHAYWRRENPTKYKVPYTILPEIKGEGHYVGVYLAWQTNSSNWWGEGEIKFYMDGDKDFPTICGTGTEDYFGGAWNFECPKGEYHPFSTAYQGLNQVIKPDALYHPNIRFGMYRWHIVDPIRFKQSLRVTIQALGWRSGGRYLPLQDDIASVVFWYQTTICEDLAITNDKNAFEVI